MKPKKSLGQNFLKSQPALAKIVEAGEISENDIILEIGPGRGALTERLLEKAGKVVAIEKDKELFAYLKEKFAGNEKLELREGDILDYAPEGKYKVIANIPYNITGAILKKFLAAANQPERMVLLLQQEVAERIMARDGKESILSVSVKAYGNPKRIMKVPARYFSPAPKVDSAVILISGISRKFFDGMDEGRFWELVKTGFAHKRKKLSNNLAEKAALGELGEKRAENLSLEDWKRLAIEH